MPHILFNSYSSYFSAEMLALEEGSYKWINSIVDSGCNSNRCFIPFSANSG